MSAGRSPGAAALAAAVLALVTVRFLVPGRARGVRRLAGATTGPPDGRSPGRGFPGSRRPAVAARMSRPLRRLVGFGSLGGVVVAIVEGPRALIPLMALGALGVVVLRQLARHRRRRTAVARRARVIEACAVLAADLRAGRTPQNALEGAATVCAELRTAAAAARLGSDVGAALDLAARMPGAAGLRSVGAAWRVAERSGAAFAAIAERLAESLRAEESVRRQIDAGLAGTRSTARLLAALPLFGTALGYGIGAAPLTFLTATPLGWGCLFGGLLLAGLGLEWVERLAAGCEQER